MDNQLGFILNRVKERLWVKPMLMCLLSIAGALVAKTVDMIDINQYILDITPDSLEDLLKIISSSMLVIATFAVGSMVAAYASAAKTATPRSFPLVIADDVSQNALSTFIGAFIFSIIALIALKNDYYDKAGRFALFILTLMVFALVIITFVRWVDRIARLGRLTATIDKVETAAAAALKRRRSAPTLGGAPVAGQNKGKAVYAQQIGYVQRVNVGALQTYADKSKTCITVAALPGTLSVPGRALAHVTADSGDLSEIDTMRITSAFIIGNTRKFDDDPRFGLIVLSEIASRALSPAVNDPGTAIDVIGRFVRLFALWVKPVNEKDEAQPPRYDRVKVPEISLHDMFDDAFTSIARDGAYAIEVAARMQKAFESLSSAGDETMQKVSMHHARMALDRAENTLKLPQDKETVRKLAAFADTV